MYFNNLQITALMSQTGTRHKNFFNRIDENIFLGKPTIILIDGKSQTGKSTFARWLCMQYDKKYLTVFQIEKILTYFLGLAIPYYNNEMDKIYNRWLLIEEPQLEVPRQEFWSTRNLILQGVTSSYGFTRNNVVMTLPNIKGISEMIYTNITFRISIDSKLDKDKNIVRKAYNKKPVWIERRNKYRWVLVERFTIPKIELPDEKEYKLLKADNFFKTQLPKWIDKLSIDKPKIKVELDKQTGNLISSIGSAYLTQ